MRVLPQQRHGGEDLSALAVAALRNLVIDPGLLHCMQPGALCEALDGDDALAGDLGDRQRARAQRCAVHVHGARAALPDAAAVLRSLDVQLVAQHP
jgi:hypothetical protein